MPAAAVRADVGAGQPDLWGSLIRMARGDGGMYHTSMRRTQPFLKVARTILENPDARQWGYDLSCRAGVRSGRLYPMLEKMLTRGWLIDGWEEPHEHRPERRPARRYYRLTEQGLHALRERVHGDDRTESVA